MTEKQLFQKIYETAKTLGADVSVVGGYVRDSAMGRAHEPEVEEENRIQAALERDLIEGGQDVIIETVKRARDIDFVLLGDAVAFATAFDGAMEKTGSLVTFPEFNTARYIMQEFDIEFAGARKEAYEKGSRKPAVQPATLDEDLSRRDFTVNAMARKVMSGKLGSVADPFRGSEDIQSRTLRTPLNPNETFSEDPLRILRAARFAAELDFRIEDATYKAMYDNRRRLAIVSKERILEEFMKLLSAPQPSVGLAILYKTKVLDEFLPEVPRLAGVEEVYGTRHKDNLWHSFRVVDNLATRTNKPLLRYAGLMHDIGKPETKKFIRGRGWAFDMHEHVGKRIVKQIGKRLRMSTDDIQYISKLVRWHQQPIGLMDTSITDSAVRRLVVNLGDDIDDLLKLCRSDITTGNPERLKRRLKNYDILEEKIIHVIEKDKLRAFQSPVRGEEIMEVCGLKAGPTVGEIKKAIEEAILDGVIPNEYEDAKKFFLEIKDGYVKEAGEWEKK